MSEPDPGTVVLFDDVLPPFEAGSYRAIATTTVTVNGADHALRSEKHIEVEAPRFVLPPHDIASLHPPANGHGAYHETLPHIVLRRRTLPWERTLDSRGVLHEPAPRPGEQAARGRTPWMALLLVEEGEGTLLTNVPLEEVVPADVFVRLGSPAGVRCDALEMERVRFDALVPSLEEVRLLAHARRVETANRAIEAGDGWFSVVMANRLPRAGARHRAVLVSLEERTDLVPAAPPPPSSGDFVHPAEFEVATFRAERSVRSGILTAHIPIPRPTSARLVALTSWVFEGGDATFAELMDRLDVGLFGATPDGEPAVTDTGHVAIALEDRAGADHAAWYRGPFVPHELARDTLGPYHSADQARRVSPETGAEDVSYAAAFEVGRLLCSADARAAGELLHWRRTAFRQAARRDSLKSAAARIGLDAALELHLAAAPAPVLAVAALERIAASAPARADRTGVAGLGAVGFDPDAVRDAFALESRKDAEAVLAIQPFASKPIPRTREVAPTDEATHDRLRDVRDRMLSRDPGDPR
jgi:hypothetical protein